MRSTSYVKEGKETDRLYAWRLAACTAGGRGGAELSEARPGRLAAFQPMSHRRGVSPSELGGDSGEDCHVYRQMEHNVWAERLGRMLPST